LYFATVLVLLALGVWRFISTKPFTRGEPGQKDGYVMMGSGSQAVLQMDPRRGDAAPSTTPSTASII
jgi:hypothetical protein